MLVHGPRPGQQSLEMAETDGQRNGQSDSRPQREAATYPVPEFEDIFRGNAELGGGGQIGRGGDEMTGDGRFVTRCSENPVARSLRVGHRFQRREGLAGDDEHGAARVEAGQHAGQIGAVEIGDEVDVDVGLLEGGQGMRRHAWPKVGSANADIDDIGDAFTRKTAPLSAVYLFAKAGEAGEDGFDLGRRGVAGTQIDVANGTTFGVIDRFASAHPLDPGAQAGLFGELPQQTHGVLVEPLFGVVEQEIVGLHREMVEARRIFGKQVAQVTVLDAPGVFGQGKPGGTKWHLHAQTATWAAMCGCGS